MGMFKDDIKFGLFFNGERLTDEAIDMAIQDMVNNQQACIDAVESGEVTVNDKDSYIDWCNEWKEKYQNREFKVTLTFLQKAYYFQTGESIAYYLKRLEL